MRSYLCGGCGFGRKQAAASRNQVTARLNSTLRATHRQVCRSNKGGLLGSQRRASRAVAVSDLVGNSSVERDQFGDSVRGPLKKRTG